MIDRLLILRVYIRADTHVLVHLLSPSIHLHFHLSHIPTSASLTDVHVPTSDCLSLLLQCMHYCRLLFLTVCISHTFRFFSIPLVRIFEFNQGTIFYRWATNTFMYHYYTTFCLLEVPTAQSSFCIQFSLFMLLISFELSITVQCNLHCDPQAQRRSRTLPSFEARRYLSV